MYMAYKFNSQYCNITVFNILYYYC